jgi:hypothetical protein
VKKLPFPILFFGFSSLLQNPFCKPLLRTCDFVYLISDTYSMGHCSTEAIRSVTHLVLALSLRKSSSVFFFSSLYIKSFFVFLFSLSFLAIDQCAHPAAAGPENLQCRSAFIQFVRTVVSPTPVVARRRRPTLV